MDKGRSSRAMPSWSIDRRSTVDRSQAKRSIANTSRWCQMRVASRLICDRGGALETRFTPAQGEVGDGSRGAWSGVGWSNGVAGYLANARSDRWSLDGFLKGMEEE